MKTREDLIAEFKALTPEQQKLTLKVARAMDTVEIMEKIGLESTAKTTLLVEVSSAIYNEVQGKATDRDRFILDTVQQFLDNHDLS